MSLLSLRNIAKSFGAIEALRGVDLDVHPGELVGLIGPSGSGKSSLLHAAGLLERPTAGTVMIDGENVGALDERTRTRLRLSRIGFVYQFHHLLPEFDARDNVTSAGAAYDEPIEKRERQRLVQGQACKVASKGTQPCAHTGGATVHHDVLRELRQV